MTTTPIRAVIDDVVSSYSARISSHKAAWPRMQRCMVQDYFDSTERGGRCEALLGPSSAEVPDAETWLVSHAMEFNGEGYNLFGGLTDELIERVSRLIEFKGQVFSLERSMPNIGHLLGVRDKGGARSALWTELMNACKAVPMLTHREILEWVKPIDHVVLGDSHALAHYESGALVSRTDGLTLHRLLETGLYASLMRVLDHPIHKLTICAGNIDIRHHLLRQPDPKAAVDKLVRSLSDQVQWLFDQHWIEQIEIVSPLPIEHAERRIPKTGFYKGTPFYGSVEARDNIRDYFDDQVNYAFDDACQIFRWPDKWYNGDSYGYADTYMERPSSVHLSPAYHRWNYEDNVPNEALTKEYT